MGVEGLALSCIEDKQVIVDGYSGQIYIAPRRSIRREFEQLVQEERRLDSELEELRDLPAETPEGDRIDMLVNTGLAADMSRALNVGAQGIGLYRTEVTFMMRDRFPSEEEQRVVYRQLLKAFVNRPVSIRTLDIGGDKALPYFPMEETNPFLGWRGIRVTLDHPEVFLVQLRAMLRANIDLENLQIMLPMITNVSEIDGAMELLHQAQAELVEEGHEVIMPPIGAMIEVPSAVYQIRDIAQKVDFLSVGSNDLIQYLLAVDRNNAHVAGLYDSLHPAVLRALVDIVDGAHDEETAVSVCGEMAGDPVSVILLLAMGFDGLSMSASRLPRAKWVVRKMTMSQAKALLAEVLQMDDPVEIRCHIESALDDAGLGGLIRAGR